VTLLAPAPADAQTSPWRRRAVSGVKLSVSLGLLWLLFSRIDLGRLWTIARQTSIPWLIAAPAAYAVSVLVGIWRWHRLLDIRHVRVPGRTVSGSFLVALFFNDFLPIMSFSLIGAGMYVCRQQRPKKTESGVSGFGLTRIANN
jgi:uncharacterized membrane protein YbhN (UPF0104 family)